MTSATRWPNDKSEGFQVGPETVQGLCDPPRSIKLRYATDTSLSISWEDPADVTTSITGYIIDVWPERNKKAARKMNSKQKQFKIDNLKKSQRYWIQLTAVCGHSGNSARLQQSL